MVYLSREEVTELARELHEQPNFTDWCTDISSPGLLKMLQKSLTALEKANAPLKFAPEEGPDFFVPLGWRPAELYNLLKVAAKLGRLSFFLRLVALLPGSMTFLEASSYYDTMSYCSPNWISNYTYEGMYNFLLNDPFGG